MQATPESFSFPGCTALVAPSPSEIKRTLENVGWCVLTWPTLAIQPPDSFALLDEAIENLFGYDWMIFINPDAARFFLQRFNQLGHDESELDRLRVCAIDQAAADALEKSRVHVDIVTTTFDPHAVIENLANFLGGKDELQRLNVVVPQASIGRDYLLEVLEESGARADVVAAYQTVASAELTRLVGLRTMLSTSSVDAIVFTNVADVERFARLFDTNDLSRLLKSSIVIMLENETSVLARFGISRAIQPIEPSANAVIEALAKHFVS